MFFLHLTSLAIGLLFLYSLFFTEAEDQKLVNADAKLCSKLQDWWDRLDATKNRNISAHARFMRGVAELTTTGFDRLFGKRLFSAQVVGVSACYKVASIFLGSLTLLLIAEYIFHIPFAIPAKSISNALFAGILFLSMGSAPLLIHKREWMRCWYAALACLGTVMFITFWVIAQIMTRNGGLVASYNPDIVLLVMLGIILTAAAGGIAFDTFFIVATRWLMRPNANPESFFNIVLNVPISLLLSLSALLGPLISVFVWHSYITPVHGAVVIIAVLVSGSNLITTLAAGVFVVLAFALLLHRLIYPFLQRPLSKLARIGVLRHKKIALCLGIYFTGYGLRAFGVKLSVSDTARSLIEALVGA
jgi:hypothetical protein